MIMHSKIGEKIEKLREEIRRHDYLYYVQDQPKISDKEYDFLIFELKKLEEGHPEFKSSDSPTERVGGGILSGFKTVRHGLKMMSLDNTYSIDELREWAKRVSKGIKQGERVDFVVEHKIDGVSANITYVAGRLKIGSTRGDGQSGEDVTENIKTIRAIPLKLMGKGIPGLIEIRGEVYMERKDFESLNKERELEGEVLFANPRNAASGSLKLLDTGIVAKRRLNFFAHSLGVYKGTKILTQWGYLENLREWGVRTNKNSVLCESLDEVIKYCLRWQKERDSLGYEIDGIVVKVNNIEQQNRLGSTLKSPRWAVAYKFPARQATTIVKDILIQVGRTGVITPVAVLEPVECSGVIIKHATLHNFDEIKRLDVKIRDRVLVERAGDVIPKVVKVVESIGRTHFIKPKVCPVCKGKLVKEKAEDVAYRCINPSCLMQLERGLLHFASRSAMDIEGLGESVAEQLVRLKLVKDFSDIYKLNSNDLEKLELFKEKKVDNLLSAIQKSKSRPLSRLIYALGIRHVGEKAALVLANRFLTMDNLVKATQKDFESIYEVGPVMTASILDYFSQSETKRLINELRDEGLNLKETVSASRNTPLSAKTVVFTGELKGFSRLKAQELAREAGANPLSSVSKKTDFVVAGANPGSKYEKAKKLGVKIIDEDQFKEMLK
jgi:DNA ligase (NAD+)